jgi:hypothetical protein
MNTKKIISHFGSAIATSLFILFAIGSGDSEKPQDNLSNNKALAEIKNEPKVIEAIITDVNVLYVSVSDDGTDRSGYASYLCEILRENKATCNRVKVVKAGTTKNPKADNAYGILLGESYCK